MMCQVMDKEIKLLISIGIPLLVLLAPTKWIPIEGITVVEHRMIAIFFLAVLLWVLEPIPVFATSIVIIVSELVMVSNKCLLLFKPSPSVTNFGELLCYEDIMATFASPVIMLFLGGFFLALAATKYQLDINLARVFIKPFGTNPKFVLLGLMTVTAVFSMFMSNTATTAMMLAILVPILNMLKPDDKGRIAFLLGVPFAANIGGMGTPIGTPPNAIALKYLNGDEAIGFGAWMSFAVPFVVIMLFFAWFLLFQLYRPKTKEIRAEIKGKFNTNWKAIIVYFTFGLTICLWLTDFIHAMNAYIVSMIPMMVFSALQIITKEDLRRIDWDVIMLLAGGIALGLGMQKSGLAHHIIQSFHLSQLSPYIIVLFASILTLMIANFMSHTATANLLLPIMAVLGSNTTSLSGVGGRVLMILIVTFSASLAMALPISTPPNALAYGTGKIKNTTMMKTGLIIGSVGLAGLYILMLVLCKIHFFKGV